MPFNSTLAGNGSLKPFMNLRSDQIGNPWVWRIVKQYGESMETFGRRRWLGQETVPQRAFYSPLDASNTKIQQVTLR